MGSVGAAVGCGAILGLLCGSFVNVCISRLPSGRSVVAPGSHCEGCGQPIRWYDNIPLLSYLVLRGRCHGCKAPIGVRHLLVELFVGLWFAACVVPLAASSPAAWSDPFFRLLIHQLSLCLAGMLLPALAVIDWRHQRLPDALTIPGIVGGLLLTCTDAMFLGADDYNLVLQRKVRLNAAGSGHSTGNIFLTGPEHLVYGRLLAVLSCFLLLWLIRRAYRAVRGRDGMGLGDAKLLAMIAALLGFAPAILSLFLGTLLAALFAVFLLLRGRATAATKLPFGTFLAAAGMLAALIGTPIVEWYKGFYR